MSSQTHQKVRTCHRHAIGTDTVLKTKLFGLKVRHFNNPCLLIAFTRSIHALFSKDETGTSPWRFPLWGV